MDMNVLLLDSSFYPIRIIDWKRAMTLFFGGRAQIIEHHEDRYIKSPSKDYPLPKVIRLITKFSHISYVKFSRDHVFYRDNFKCQYCAASFKKSELTLDHVMPKSRGGDTSWVNIVTACKTCNNKKADKTPTEAKMPLMNRPKEPNALGMMIKKVSHSDILDFKNWLT